MTPEFLQLLLPTIEAEGFDVLTVVLSQDDMDLWGSTVIGLRSLSPWLMRPRREDLVEPLLAFTGTHPTGHGAIVTYYGTKRYELKLDSRQDTTPNMLAWVRDTLRGTKLFFNDFPEPPSTKSRWAHLLEDSVF